jgi:hypothetical protein
MVDLKRLNHTLLDLQQTHLNQHESKISDQSGGFQNYRQLVRMQLDQFPVRQFVRIPRCIKAIIPDPVPISKMLGFLLGPKPIKRHQSQFSQSLFWRIFKGRKRI